MVLSGILPDMHPVGMEGGIHYASDIQFVDDDLVAYYPDNHLDSISRICPAVDLSLCCQGDRVSDDFGSIDGYMVNIQSSPDVVVVVAVVVGTANDAGLVAAVYAVVAIGVPDEEVHVVQDCATDSATYFHMMVLLDICIGLCQPLLPFAVCFCQILYYGRVSHVVAVRGGHLLRIPSVLCPLRLHVLYWLRLLLYRAEVLGHSFLSVLPIHVRFQSIHYGRFCIFLPVLLDNRSHYCVLSDVLL